VSFEDLIPIFKLNILPRYDREVFELTLDGILHSIKLHDTAGQEEYDRIRKIAYKEADAFILCYSIDNKASFENIKMKWIPELRNLDRRVPIVLVGESPKNP
jgi:Ras-related C3 botulinum toxin substrate 1